MLIGKMVDDSSRKDAPGLAEAAARNWARLLSSRPHVKISEVYSPNRKFRPARYDKPRPHALRCYATELACANDQLVGWGIKIVVDEARAAGHMVEYVKHPPDGLLDRPDVWFLSLPYSGNAWMLGEFFEALGEPADREMRDRRTTYILGGHGVLNTEPLLDIADAVFVGEADDRIAEILAAVPYDESMDSVPGLDTGRADHVIFQVAAGLGKRGIYLASQDSERRVGSTRYLEVARGCRAKCKFCEIGWIYGYTERSREETEQLSQGDRAVVYSAPDTDGVSWFSNAVAETAYTPRWRSTRVAAYLKQPQASRDGRRRRIRFGVEGVTEKLRQSVGKPIRDDQLRDAMVKARLEGYSSLQVCLIAGLPGETRSDRTHVIQMLDTILQVGWNWNCVKVKITGLSPQPFTPWQREGIFPAIEALADYRYWKRQYAPTEQRWRMVTIDAHQTEADLIKRMRRAELLSYLRVRPAGTVPGPADRRWMVVRGWAALAGIDYDSRVLEPIHGELPWHRIRPAVGSPASRLEQRAMRAIL